jgi:hypothetical protein
MKRLDSIDRKLVRFLQYQTGEVFENFYQVHEWLMSNKDMFVNINHNSSGYGVWVKHLSNNDSYTECEYYDTYADAYIHGIVDAINIAFDGNNEVSWTRDEEISAAAETVKLPYTTETSMQDMRKAFVLGAEWADANPILGKNEEESLGVRIVEKIKKVIVGTNDAYKLGERIINLSGYFGHHSYFKEKMWRKLKKYKDIDEAEVWCYFFTLTCYNEGVFFRPLGSGWASKCSESQCKEYLDTYQDLLDDYKDWCEKQR